MRLPADFRATPADCRRCGRRFWLLPGAAGPHRQPARLPGRRLVSVPLGRRSTDRPQDHGGGRGHGVRAVGRTVVPFNLRSRDLGMKSTARFIGVLEQTGRLQAENVLFANLELEDRKTRLPEATFRFLRAGVPGVSATERRALAGSPLYRITFAHPQDACPRRCRSR